MPLETPTNEFNIGKQILEIKKKIQLSEGQRKAHFEECDAEKRKNTDKIRQLKKDVKEIYDKLGKPVKCEEVISKRSKSARSDLHSLRNKSPDQARNVIDYRIIDLNKKWDLLKYRHKKLEDKQVKLQEIFEQLLMENAMKQARESKTEKPPEKQRVCELENQIHHTELNAMEAVTIRRKYRQIRSGLLDDSVRFEAALRQVEADIRKQDNEINRLQRIKSEALGLRDATRGLLQKQEELSMKHGKERDRKLQEHRHVVEERRLELEVLERQLFPTSGVVPQMHRDSVSSLDNAMFVGGTEEANQPTSSTLEDNYKKLMVATGEVEPELVTLRFTGQKETRARLTYLRGLTEEDKRKMEITKSELNAQLESAKFAAEVKDKEQNLEEVDSLKQQIQEQEANLKNYKLKITALETTRKQITNSLRKMCALLKDFGPELPSDFDDMDATALLVLVEQKLKAVLEIALQKEEEERIRQQAAKSRLDSRSFVPVMTEPQVQLPHKPSGPQSEDEEDVPTRGFLKRQAQVIVDAKSRRRFFRPSKSGKGKTPLHLRK